MTQTDVIDGTSAGAPRSTGDPERKGSRGTRDGNHGPCDNDGPFATSYYCPDIRTEEVQRRTGGSLVSSSPLSSLTSPTAVGVDYVPEHTRTRRETFDGNLPPVSVRRVRGSVRWIIGPTGPVSLERVRPQGRVPLR